MHRGAEYARPHSGPAHTSPRAVVGAPTRGAPIARAAHYQIRRVSTWRGAASSHISVHNIALMGTAQALPRSFAPTRRAGLTVTDGGRAAALSCRSWTMPASRTTRNAPPARPKSLTQHPAAADVHLGWTTAQAGDSSTVNSDVTQLADGGESRESAKSLFHR